MANKILYVCQEISPYLPETESARLCRALTQAMQERGNEIRTFMPRYGCINERRHQLHEVKAVLTDPDGNFFPDNDERAIFFARGVLETVKKLRWTPSVVHCHGWFSAIVPVYLKHVFADDPIFRDVKIVVSLYGDAFPGELDPEFRAKIEGEGIKDKNLDLLNAPSYENLCRFVMNYADGMVAASPDIDERVLDEIRKCGKPLLEYQNPEAEDFFDNYNRFYEAIQ